MRTHIALCAALLSALSLSAIAKPVPDNLGNGLDKLVENNLILKGQITAPAPASTTSPKTSVAKKDTAKNTVISAASISAYNASVAKVAARIASNAITEQA